MNMSDEDVMVIKLGDVGKAAAAAYRETALRSAAPASI